MFPVTGSLAFQMHQWATNCLSNPGERLQPRSMKGSSLLNSLCPKRSTPLKLSPPPVSRNRVKVSSAPWFLMSETWILYFPSSPLSHPVPRSPWYIFLNISRERFLFPTATTKVQIWKIVHISQYLWFFSLPFFPSSLTSVMVSLSHSLSFSTHFHQHTLSSPYTKLSFFFIITISQSVVFKHMVLKSAWLGLTGSPMVKNTPCNALVRSLVQEDPTWHRATKPMRHNYWAWEPQLMKTHALQPMLHNKRNLCSEKPAHCHWRVDPLAAPQLEKKSTKQWRPSTGAKGKFSFKKCLADSRAPLRDCFLLRPGRPQPSPCPQLSFLSCPPTLPGPSLSISLSSG